MNHVGTFVRVWDDRSRFAICQGGERHTGEDDYLNFSKIYY